MAFGLSKRCFSATAAPFVASNHPRRSVLYMPGSNARAMEKGKTLAADGLILDLEDAVAINKKVPTLDFIDNPFLGRST